jgi:hypothetical protein
MSACRLFTKNAEYDDLISGYYQYREGIHFLLIILDGTIFIPKISYIQLLRAVYCTLMAIKLPVYRILFVSDLSDSL